MALGNPSISRRCSRQKKHLELGSLMIKIKLLARLEVHFVKLSWLPIGFRSRCGAALYLGIRNMI